MATSDYDPQLDTPLSARPGYRRNSGIGWTIGIIVIIAIVIGFVWLRPTNNVSEPANNAATAPQINSAPAVTPPMTTPGQAVTPAPSPTPAPQP